jgi:hypothetical protein
MNVERTREFVVAGSVVAEQQELGLAIGKRGQHGSHTALFL